ncbi:MAG TPA: transglycosylase domain-containing protein, partial [Ramlibacter sp.]|nr:transglycosylase domain-containing protein [Ramlibacter sp.]
MRPRTFLQAALALSVLVVAVVAWEIQTSTLQARFFPAWARELRFELQPGASPGNAYPRSGPFDERVGYSRIPEWIARLSANEYSVTTQARQADALARHIQDGFFAPYHEKKQAGLGVLDCRREPLFKVDFPQKAYPSYAAIPPLVVDTLAFIENREIVTATEATHNPALEWPRLGRALLDQGMKAVDPSRHGAGGSTLATQLEKFRHSPAGRTASAQDKYRQVVSASLRAYMDGPETVAARQRILLDYVNSLPLGAQRHVGEVVGILDGVRLWYGADVAALNQAMRANAT